MHHRLSRLRQFHFPYILHLRLAPSVKVPGTLWPAEILVAFREWLEPQVFLAPSPLRKHAIYT